jgi:hypothetical protein
LNLRAYRRDAGHCPTRPDNVRLEVSVLEVLRKTWLGYFHFIHTPLLIVWYSYTQEILKKTSLKHP